MDWKQLSLHAETHIVNTVYCAHQDCDALLRSPAELVEHNRGHTEENSALRPSAYPSAPQEPLVLPPVPGTLPVYEVLAPPVGMPSIAPERHMALGPWVLRNICAPVNVRAGKRYNAAIPLRADGAKAAAAAAYQPDYEFLETSSMHYSCLPSRPARVREVADLKSKEVSDLVARGQLVLWPGPVAVAASVSGGTAAEEEELAVESMLQGEAESDSTRLGVE
ncbi:hypothetical protein B0H10DRAFT_2060673 [Mycena sp. CBHHK59/15]|nr:hypothetical protein B0H10DRAFT_2060673 [Mycena sp. CBHHK59/15]